MSSTSQSEFDLPQAPENPGLYSRPTTQPPPQPRESTTTIHSTDHGDGRTHDGTGAGATTSDADADPTSDEFALLGAEQPAPPVTAADVRAWAASNDGTATVPRRKTSAGATIRPLVGHLFPVATKVEFLMAAVGSLDIEQGTERDTAEVVAALRRAKAMLEACAALAVTGAEAAASLMSMGPDGDCGEFAVDGYAHDHDDELIAIWDLSTLNTCDLEPVSKSTDSTSAGGEVPAKQAPLLGSITGVIELLVLAGMRRQGSDLYYRFLTDPTSNETAASETEFTYDDYGDIVDKPAAPAALPVPPMITIIKATITNELQKIAAARDRQPTCSASSNADGSTAASPFVSKHEHGRDATVPVLSKYGPMLGAFDKMSRSLDVAPDFYPAFETDFLDWLKLRNYFCLATVCAGTGPGADTWLDYFAEARRRCQDVLERVEAAHKKLRIPSVATLPVALLRETNSLRHLLELQQQQEAEMAQLRRDAAAAAALASKSSPPPASGNSNSSAPRTPVTSPPLGPHGAAGSFGARPSPGKLQPDALSGGVVTPHRPSGGGGAGVSSGRKSSRLASPLTEQSPYVQSPAYLLTRTPLHGVDRDLFLIARPTDRCPLRLPGEPMGLLNIRQSCFVNCFAQAFFAVPGFTSCVFKFPAPHDLKEARAGLVSASTSPSRAPRSSQPAGTAASSGLQRAPSTGSNSGALSGGKESAVPPRQLQCERVVHRLQALFAYMRHSASSYANPTPLLDAVAALFPAFSDGGQHDPQEFCDAVMTAVVEAYVGLPVSLKERLSSEADHVRQSLCNPQESSQPPTPSLSVNDAVTARGLDWRGMCECALLHQPVLKPSATSATATTTNDDGVDSGGRIADGLTAPTATLMRGPCIIPAYFAANEEEAEPSPARGGGRGSAIRTLSLTSSKTPSPPPQPVSGDATIAATVSAEGAQVASGAAKHVDPMATSALQDRAVSNAGAPATSPPISATSVSTMSEPPSSTKAAHVQDSEKGSKAAGCSAVSPMNVGDVQNERRAHTAPSSSDDDGDDGAASPSFVTRLEHSIADFFTDCCEAVAEDAMSEAPVGTVKAFLSQEHAPSTLMVHLPMRLAGVDAKTGLPLKSDAEVSLPEVLDMTAYCCPPVTAPAPKLSSLKAHDSCRSDGKPQLHPNSRPATPSANDLVPPSKNTEEENVAQSQEQVAQEGEEFPQRVDDSRRTALVHMKAAVAAATATALTCDAAYREAAAAADKLSHPRHAHTLSPSLAFGSTSGAGAQDQPSPSEIAAKAAFAAADAIRTAGDDARRTAVRGRAQVSAVQAALTTPSAPAAQYSNDDVSSSAGSGEPLLYDCASVIVHVGDTADTGHYVTFAKHWITAPSSNQEGGDGDSCARQGDRQRRPQWFIFDDTVTREVSTDDAMRSEFVRRNCYCVVYTKRPHFASSPVGPQYRLDELPSERQRTDNVEDDGVSPLTTPATSHVVSPVAQPAVRQCPAAAAWAAAAAVAAPRHLSKIVEREDKRILDKAYKRTMQSE